MRGYVCGRVLRGAERRELRNQIAFERADFELEFEESEFYREARESGATIEPFERAQIVRAIPERYRDELGHITINVSDAFVRETQRKVEGMRYMIKRAREERE